MNNWVRGILAFAALSAAGAQQGALGIVLGLLFLGTTIDEAVRVYQEVHQHPERRPDCRAPREEEAP